MKSVEEVQVHLNPKDVVIVLVDDDAPILKLMATILEMEGFKVHSFSNGEDSLEFIRKNADSIDLLVTDIRMPGMNGKELAFQANLVKPDLQVLFVTAYSSYSHEVNDTGREMKGRVLQKPFRPSELLSNVKGILKPS
jgi:DNA-binding response OmpR family regulator